MNDHDEEVFDDLQPRPSIDEVIEALASQPEIPGTVLTYGLANLTDSDTELLRTVWMALDDDHRARLLIALLEANETNPELQYVAMARLGLQDESADVREAAVNLLWEEESPATLNALYDLALADPSDRVRAAAFAELGRFILAAELGQFPDDLVDPARRLAARVMNDESQPVDVRRRALEAASNATMEGVADAINRAYRSGDRRLQISALFAMGRSCDERWSGTVIQQLSNEDPEFRYEAARAAGEIQIEEAVPVLAQAAYDEDLDVRDTAIWSLGEIGGPEATQVLRQLAVEADASGDAELATAIADAIATSELNGDDWTLFRYDADSRN